MTKIVNRWDTARVLVEDGAAKDSETLEAAVRVHADLRSANLYGANLYGANLYGANLYGANLYGANLVDADLRSADLRSADLRGANLVDANLYGANLYGADLSGADLSGADLSGANLSGADLSGADLCSANLVDANLSSADLRGANLRGANLVARINWQSHDLIAEVLRQAARDDPERRAFAGLVLVSHDWCWAKWAALAVEYPRVGGWALGVLRGYVKDGDDLPKELRAALEAA